MDKIWEALLSDNLSYKGKNVPLLSLCIITNEGSFSYVNGMTQIESVPQLYYVPQLFYLYNMMYTAYIELCET